MGVRQCPRCSVITSGKTTSRATGKTHEWERVVAVYCRHCYNAELAEDEDGIDIAGTLLPHTCKCGGGEGSRRRVLMHAIFCHTCERLFKSLGWYHLHLLRHCAQPPPIEHTPTTRLYGSDMPYTAVISRDD